MKLQGKQIYLKETIPEENYPWLLKWLTDIEIVGYLYSAKRLVNFKTILDIKNFLAEEKDEMFWEIYTQDNDFIGYTSLSDFQDKEQCEFSIFILDKNYWGKGIGLEVTNLILDYAFNELGMKKIILETSEFHQGAIKLYEQAGFKKVKIVPNDRTIFHNGKWVLSGSVVMEIKKAGLKSKLAIELEKLINNQFSNNEIASKFLQRIKQGNLTKDENPKSHFCVYFAAHDPRAKQIFIGHHKKSGLWLVNGGHIDRGESLREALGREINEEWGLDYTDLKIAGPQLLTITKINNPQKQPCRAHYDVWYFVAVDKNSFQPDKTKLAEEFHENQWVDLETAKQRFITEKNHYQALDFLKK